MTIKQQGGIFGRNPTFNDLTVEGTFTTSGAQTMDELNVDNLNINGNTISSTDTNGNINLTPNGSGLTLIKSFKGTNYFEFRKDTAGGSTLAYLVNDAEPGTTTESVGIAFAPANNLGAVAQILAKRTGTYSSTGTRDTELQFYNSVDSNPTHQWTITNAGNLKAVTSGNGIDFSATTDGSGTTTSELFSDYEEGTFDPEISTTGTSFTSVTYDAITGGKYTKVGNIVHIQIQMRTDAITIGSASGTLIISNLPFTSSSNTSGNNGRSTISLHSGSSWAGNYPQFAYVEANSTYITLLAQTALNSDITTMSPTTDVSTGGNGNTFNLAGTYIAA